MDRKPSFVEITRSADRARTARAWRRRTAARRDTAPERRAARAFLASYLELLHAGGAIGALRHASPQLVRELRRHPPRVTPAQRATRTRVRRLEASAQPGGTARVQATLRTSGGPSFSLLLYLERRASRWLVTRIADA